MCLEVKGKWETETKLNYKMIGGDETKVKIIRDNGGRYTLVKKSEVQLQDFLLVQKACNTIPVLKERNITPQKFINCSVQLVSLDKILSKQQNKTKRRRKRRINLPKLFKCVFCGRRFLNLFFLNNHQRSHHKVSNGTKNTLNAPEFQNFVIKENKFQSENGVQEKILPIRISLVQSKNNALLPESVVLKENKIIIDEEALENNNNDPHVEEGCAYKEWSKSAEKYHKKLRKHRRERDKPESEENTTNENRSKVLCEGVAYFDDRVAQFKGELLIIGSRELPKLQEKPHNLQQSINHEESMTGTYQQNSEKALNPYSLIYSAQSTNQATNNNCSKSLKRKNCTETAQRKKKRFNRRKKQTDTSGSEFETTDDDLQKQQPRRSCRQKVNPCYSDAIVFGSDSTDIDEYLPYQQFESKRTPKRRNNKGRLKSSENEDKPKKIALTQDKPKQTEVEDGEINSDEDFSCLVLQLSESEETTSIMKQEETETKNT